MKDIPPIRFINDRGTQPVTIKTIKIKMDQTKRLSVSSFQ